MCVKLFPTTLENKLVNSVSEAEEYHGKNIAEK